MGGRCPSGYCERQSQHAEQPCARECAREVAEAVDHPAHYGGADNPYEAIKVIEAWLGPDGAAAFCRGNALKYLARAGQKADPVVQDLRKARWYLDREIALRGG